MGRTPAASIALSIAAVGLAGCLDAFGEDLETFPPLDVPRWEAGYWWAYEATSLMTSSYTFEGEAFDMGPRHETEDVIVRVFNTTEPLRGEPVYYIRNDNPVDSPLFEGSVQALTKQSLALAGVGGHGGVAYPTTPSPPPKPLGYPMTHDGPAADAPPPPPDPCMDRVPMQAVGAAERFEQFRFPLEHGSRWAGVFRLGFAQTTVRYTATVDGLEPVEVPAGVYDAVRTTIDLVPSVPIEEDDFFVDARIQVQNWYSPDVSYVVKSTTTTKVKGIGPDGAGFRYEHAATLELLDHSLEAGAAEPAPIAAVDAGPAERVPLAIVADTAFPVDLGAGPVAVRFGLVARDNGPDSYYSPPILQHAGRVPEEAPIDEAHYEVLWHLRGGMATTLYRVGDTLAVNLTEAARYEVRADVRPTECGYPGLGSADAWFPTAWRQTYEVAVATAGGDPIQAGTFPVRDEPTQAILTWGFDPAAGVRVDAGRPAIVDPSGVRAEVHQLEDGFAHASLYPAMGAWRLMWEPDGVPVGDDVTITLAMDFGARPSD